jgi:thioredoxin reductase (NADPH)
MLGLSCVVVDSLDQPGGQCAALYPEKQIFDIPAFGSITGFDLTRKLMDQAQQFDPQFHLRSVVERLTPGADGRFSVTVSRGGTFDVGAIIIAAGAGSFLPNRPNLQNLEAFEDRSVFYSVADLARFVGKRIVIAGGGDSAVDWANELAGIASVTLVHRRAKFKAHPASLRKLDDAISSKAVKLAVPFQLESLEGDIESGILRHVNIVSLAGEKKAIDADILLPLYGLSSQLGPIANWGLSISKGQIEVEPTSCATNIDGVYAIGDIAHYPRKLKLILTGFAEAAQACYAARERLRPESAHLFVHSTDRGKPGTTDTIMTSNLFEAIGQ